MAYRVTDTIIVDQSRNLGSIGVATFAGPLLIGGGSSTGTVSQPLQVLGTNGAYIGGNLGIGSTNPSSKLSIIGDATFSGIVTSSVLNVRKDPGTGIATDFTNSLFGNGWRLSAPASTTYYRLATLPVGSGGNTFDHLRIEGTLGAWTNDNQTPFDIIFSNRGAFDYKYISYGSIRSDVRIIGISTNSTVEIWAQHQASAFTKLVYNITESVQAIVVSNPTSTTTAPVGTTVFDSSTTQTRFIINESDNVGIGTTNPGSKLTVNGAVQIQQDSGSNNRFILRGQPASLYRWNIDNFGSANDFRIFREDDVTAANGVSVVSISTAGTLTATRFSGDGSLLTNLPTSSSQWVTTTVGIHTLSNVGIGTTNPTSKLTVSGNASITGILTADQVYTSNNGTGQNVRIGDDLWIGDINAPNTTRFSGAQDSTKAFIVFGSSDTVALGRTGTGPLYYGGDFTISGVATANSFRARGGAPGALGVNNNGYGFFAPGDNDSGMYSSADGQIEFYTNNTEAIRINNNQRVGIGTTNPTQTLHVQGNARVTGAVYDSTNSAGTSGQVLQSTATGTQWVAAAPSGAVSGITVRDSNNNIIGTSGSITQLTFSTGLSVVGTTGAAGIATITLSNNLVGTALSVSGISTLSNATGTNLNFAGVGTITNLVGTNINVTGIVTANSFVGSGASLTTLNASNLSSGIVPSARITASSGDFSVGQNLFVSGNVTIGGTTTQLNAQQLRISDRDITLGVTTNINGNDVSTDITANHGGISIASTVGTPIIGIPTDTVNNDPSTYKQIMWVREGHYSGFATDAWIFNYGVSIGNTATVQNLSRLTVGAGFTVYDNYIDVQDIRNRNINTIGISTFTNARGTNINFTGVGTITTFNATTSTITNETGTNLNFTGVSTLTNARGTNINFTGVSTLGITTFTGLVSFGTSAYFGDNDFAYFGDAGDLYIGHNGSISAIADFGTGDLYIAGDNSLIITDLSYAENKAKFNTNGSVELYFDNVREFETTGYGATVYGILQSQGLQVSGISTFTQISAGGTTGLNQYVLSSTGTGLSWQPVTSVGGGTLSGIVVQDEGSTVGTAGSITTLNFVGTNVTASAVVLGNIATITVSDTPNFNTLRVTGVSTFTNGPVFIGAATSTGTASQRLQVTGGAYVSGNAGIGTTNPTSTLQVQGTVSVSSTTTSAEFVGGGSDLRNLSGTHLVSYASASDISNSALSIAGISTYNQVGILTGSLAADSSDNFGSSVATSADGKTIVVGAFFDETGATTDTGVVYVFDRVGNSFNQVGILTGSLAADSSDNFGWSVATSADGKTIVVGARSDEIGATLGTGVVYVFDRVGNSFNQVGILTGSLAVDAGDSFGSSVVTSADGKTIVVGAPSDEIGATTGTGVVYVFDRVGNSFNQVGILTGSLAVDGGLSQDRFGSSVVTSADGKTIVVGAPSDEIGATTGTGVVYVFDRVGNSFNQVGILTGSLAVNASDNFGYSAATSADGKTIIVGAYFDEIGATLGTGVVYVFDRVGNSFNQVGILTGSLAVNASDNFGTSVATSADGKTIVVGAYEDEIGATTSTGVVYVFNRQGNSFNQVGILTGSLAVNASDNFGFNVATSADGETIIAGAYQDEIGATTETGVVYVFDQTRDTYVYSGPTGNIGIGTALPTSKFEVSGTSRFFTAGQGDVSITHSSLVSTVKGASTVQLALGANNTETIRINNSNQVGIGTASPAFTADIAGDARVTSTNKMRFGGTAGTTNFYIQYNSTANSLDFVAG
jgi:hypothetical protein